MKTYIALLTAALLSSAAFAQQEPQTPPAGANAATAKPPASVSPGLAEIFDQLDTNHDGKLSQEEAQAAPAVAQNFAAADRDHDGTVSKEEFLAAFKTGPQ
jgi:EF hand